MAWLFSARWMPFRKLRPRVLDVPKITGKIAAIIGARSVVINRGRSHSVKTGMIFVVQLELPSITDPDDPSVVLEGLYYEKGRIRVGAVYDKMSFAALLGKPKDPGLQALEELTKTYPNVEPKTVIDPDDWVIQVGDKVIEVEPPPESKPTA